MIRSILYQLARLLGDMSSINRSVKRGSLGPIGKRVARRAVGKLTGRLLRKLF